MEFESEIFDEIYRTGEDGIPEFKYYAAGEWKFGESSFEIDSPITGETIARVSEPSEESITQVLDKVYNQGRQKIDSYPGEKRIESFLEVAEMIESNFDDFLSTEILDAGKTKSNANGEVEATITRLRRTTMEMERFLGDFIPGDWSEETLESEGIVKREPYGVILAISPFNYPLFISSTKVIPGLLSGNAVILKPPSVDPVTPLLFTRVLEQSGIPKESFADLTVQGQNITPVVEDGRIRAITFTGSTNVGAKIMKNAGIKSFHMELGGKDPAVVLKDADLDMATEKVKRGVTSFSGQRCDAIRMVLVNEEIYDEFKRKLVSELESVKIGNPLEEEDVDMGPLIDKGSVEEIETAHKEALEKGANSLVEFESSGRYVSPSLLEIDKDNLSGLKAFEEETFGPQSLLIEVSNKDEAVEIANSTKYGLDASIFGKDENEIRKVAKRLEVGAVFINEYPRHGVGYYPFGGMKCSGIGREGVGYSVKQLTTTKTIVHNFKGAGVWDYL